MEEFEVEDIYGCGRDEGRAIRKGWSKALRRRWNGRWTSAINEFGMKGGARCEIAAYLSSSAIRALGMFFVALA